MKFKLWEGGDLTGVWEISHKIDGVRCHNQSTGHYSRKGKPLYNIPEFGGNIAEIFCGSFKETIEATRTFTKEKTITTDQIYLLDPFVDPRLVVGTFTNPDTELINLLFAVARAIGHEGLVLKQGEKRLKVKPEETHDVIVTGIFEGKGKFIGMLGGFNTDMGNVGTGLTDVERVQYFTTSMIGETIEVSCMHLTADGKFRHPRFVRLREDK